MTEETPQESTGDAVSPSELPLDPEPYVLYFNPSQRLTAEDAYWESRVTHFAPRDEYEPEYRKYPMRELRGQ